MGLPQHSSKSCDWWSPPELVKPCRASLGGVIDLDPASCPEANEVVQANRIFTVAEDGLEQDWYGNVYLNPPYGKVDEKPEWSSSEKFFGTYSVKEIWIEKFLLELESGRVSQGILVITSSTGDAWFHKLVVPTADKLCFPRRIPFIRGGGSRQNGQPGASVVVYYGPSSWRFALEMAEIGWVVLDWVRRLPTTTVPR